MNDDQKKSDTKNGPTPLLPSLKTSGPVAPNTAQDAADTPTVTCEVCQRHDSSVDPKLNICPACEHANGSTGWIGRCAPCKVCGAPTDDADEMFCCLEHAEVGEPATGAPKLTLVLKD